MLLRILFVLLALGPLAAPLDAGWLDSVTSYFSKPGPSKPPKIRVLVVDDQQGVVVEVKGKYKIYDPHNGEHLSTRFVGKRKFMQAVRDGLKWGEEFPGLYQLMIVPDETATTTIVDGIEYRGPIYVYDIGGTISVINEVSIEDYLSSILAQRYHKKMPEELLAAVAIVARTNAYYAAVITWSLAIPSLIISLVAATIFYRLNSLDQRYVEGLDDTKRGSLAKIELERLFHSQPSQISSEEITTTLKNVNRLLENEIFGEETIKNILLLKSETSLTTLEKSLADLAFEKNVSLIVASSSAWFEQGRYGLPSYDCSLSVNWNGNPSTPIDIVYTRKEKLQNEEAAEKLA